MGNGTYTYLIKNDVLLVEKDIHAKDHHHHAVKVLIQIEKDSHILFNGKSINHNTIIFNADKVHSLISSSNWLIILLINPDSKLGDHIRNKYLVNNNIFSTDIEFSPHIIYHFNEIVSNPLSDNKILHIYDEVISTVCGVSSDSFNIDQRIEKILTEINELEEKKIPVKDLASLACLSESRFMHLFREEVRIPIRPYLAWVRLIEAIKMIAKGSTLTEAALYSGFTDLPHMHKTFAHFFGVKITDYIKNSRFIQVVEDSSI